MAAAQSAQSQSMTDARTSLFHAVDLRKVQAWRVLDLSFRELLPRRREFLAVRAGRQIELDEPMHASANKPHNRPGGRTSILVG